MVAVVGLAGSEAERVKKEHRKAAEQLRKLQAQISALKTKLANDYGPSGQFVKMAEQCFSLTLNQYVYEVCPYSKAIQKEGHITTRLGEWGGFADNYSQMKFERGDQCWNGPPRSLTVKLRCGLGNQISSVDEPSRCEYTAILTTPAACDIAQAKALEEELEAKERELTGPGEHDEL